MKPQGAILRLLFLTLLVACSFAMAEEQNTVVLRTVPIVLGGLAGTRQNGGTETGDSTADQAEWQDERMRSFFVEWGVPFGVGSFVRYNAKTGHLSVRNTADNIKRIRRLLKEAGLEPFNVAVTLSLYVLPTDTLSEPIGRTPLTDLITKQPAAELRQVVSCSGNTAEFAGTTRVGNKWYHQTGEVTPVVGADLAHIGLDVQVCCSFSDHQERPNELPREFTTQISTLDGASFVLYTKTVPADKEMYVWAGKILLLDYDGHPYRPSKGTAANKPTD